jgi:glycerophosphoryl diester phosphodiesterase
MKQGEEAIMSPHETALLAAPLDPEPSIDWVGLADTVLLTAPAGEPGSLLQRLLPRAGIAARPPVEEDLLSPTVLFDTFASPGRAALHPLADVFAVVARPGETPDELRPGDVLVRRALGEGGLGHLAMLVSGELWRSGDVPGLGLATEVWRSGWYAPVLEAGSRLHTSHAPVVRRILDERGRVPAEQLLLRLRPTLSSGKTTADPGRTSAQEQTLAQGPDAGHDAVLIGAEAATPNTWAMATVKNDWGSRISNVTLNHRYDNDHYDVGSWSSLAQGETARPTFKVGYWTGFGRTGYDYWLPQFEADGKIWTCKENFYCFLTDADKNKTVVCRVYKDGDKGKMEVQCPGSSHCTVTLTSRPKKESPTARPIYVIAHRCNDPEDIGRAVSQGANAIECDLQYDATTGQIFVNHDYAIGTNIFEWLNHAKRIAHLYGDKFALIIFDTKFAAGRDPAISGPVLRRVRDLVREVLTSGPNPINVLYSISDYDKRAALAPIMNDLRPNEGVAIDENDEPAEVEAHFSRLGVANVWYGDGIFTAGVKDVYPYVEKGARLRDANKKIKKVYVWTLASKTSIRKFIKEAKADGVMVNAPGTTGPSHGLEEALEVVGEWAGARLARRSDPAFAVHGGSSLR